MLCFHTVSKNCQALNSGSSISFKGLVDNTLDVSFTVSPCGSFLVSEVKEKDRGEGGGGGGGSVRVSEGK